MGEILGIAFIVIVLPIVIATIIIMSKSQKNNAYRSRNDDLAKRRNIDDEV